MTIPLTGPVAVPTERSPAPDAPSAAAPRRWLNASDAMAVLAVALGYFGGTLMGFALTSSDVPIATFWPPNAILLACFLLAPLRLWGFILVALVPTHFLAQLNNGVPILTSLGWLVGNVAEALLGAALIIRFGGRRALFESLYGVSRFLLFGFVIAPMTTTFFDAAIVVGTNWGRDYWTLWVSRLLSNMLAQLAIVPLIVTLAERRRIIAAAPLRTWLHAAGLAVAVIVVGLFVFRTGSLSYLNVPVLIYLPLPLLLWAAMRFGPAGESATLLTIALISIYSLMQGRGLFISPSAAESVLSMQLFLCSAGVPLLMLASVTLERRVTEVSLRKTSHKLINAQERERQLIARELHDDIGQAITLAEIEFDRILADTPELPPDAPLRKLRAQMTTISRGLWEISHGLYPSNLEYLGLATALNRLCADLRQQTNLQIRCDTADVPRRLPDDVALCFYRFAQEALQNVVKHSQATSLTMRLQLQHGRLTMLVVDDGVGFDPSRVSSGLGLASMRERLKSVQGSLNISSRAGRGTRLVASIPLVPQRTPAVQRA